MAIFKGKQELVLDNLALRQQLAIHMRKKKRPNLKTSDRVFWVPFSKIWDGWKSSLVIVKPDTVIS